MVLHYHINSTTIRPHTMLDATMRKQATHVYKLNNKTALKQKRRPIETKMVSTGWQCAHASHSIQVENKKKIHNHALTTNQAQIYVIYLAMSL
jgi:hypothetical protein